MRILIASSTLKVTQALRQFTQQQVTKLQRVNKQISTVHVSLNHRVKGSKRDQNALVKYVVSLPGKTIVVKAKAVDMYKAIVAATDDVVRQVRKAKEKQLAQHRRAATS